MSRTAARITQADVARSIRAAKQAGAGTVEIRPDGSIFIHLIPLENSPTLKKELEDHERPIL